MGSQPPKGQQRLEILGCGAYTMKKGGKAQKRTPPPTAAKCLTSCLRCACIVPATCVLCRENDKGAPPPHTPPPPQGLGMKVEGGGMRTPRGQSGRVGRQRREGAGRTTRPCP